ncbi:diaminopimelate decarboxylase [Rhodococcus tukisamuensis]|uniref:Diaminopimelate decarboxylase n=1 Tax=Rhodococcus tukisamuensis TaxID=168276 RepID=A0A1G7AAH7_9NOCA|nr:diaminopimelate decarboxylase [Rhodococcus tukisamuensis]SDE11507.1 diaminopimelate decarboxylase [Rhodococcus tukisamuensis]
MTLLEIFPSLRSAMTPRLDPAVWPASTHVDDHDRITVAGVALADIADQYGTPSYVLDELDLRHRCRTYREVFPEAEIAYAGKALLTRAVATWVTEEGLSLDVCSAGELAIALSAGVNPRRIIMHGNAKTPAELSAARDAGVGRIVIDSHAEITLLAATLTRRQNVLVRVTPGIDAHTHRAVATGVTDQKFGFPLEHGQADEAVRRVLGQPRLNLIGLHCHLGSQITEVEHFRTAVDRMIAQMAQIRIDHGTILTELNLGGGHGISYVCGDPQLDLSSLAATLDDALDDACARHRFPRPRITLEPGRAVAGRAGVTVYRVVSVKHVTGGRTFVCVDGGMSDNPRVALYGAHYSVALANRHSIAAPAVVTVAGRHCEAGDELAVDVQLPSDLHPGDVLAVPGTGAYHHSLASTYNAVGRPPIVAVRDGRSRELIRRETVEDLLRREVSG